MVTQQEFDEATKRGDEMHRALPHALGVRFDANTRLVTVDLNWGYSISFSPERSEYLHLATDEELSEVEIAGVWGIYFPRIDTDLSVPDLAKGIFGSSRWEETWAAAHRTDKAA